MPKKKKGKAHRHRSAVPTLTPRTFDAWITGASPSSPRVVVFSSRSCPPCRELGRALEERGLAAKLAPVKIAKTNDKSLRKRLGISAVPTAIRWLGDLPFDRRIGFGDDEDWRAWVQSDKPEPPEPSSEPYGVIFGSPAGKARRAFTDEEAKTVIDELTTRGLRGDFELIVEDATGMMERSIARAPDVFALLDACAPDSRSQAKQHPPGEAESLFLLADHLLGRPEPLDAEGLSTLRERFAAASAGARTKTRSDLASSFNVYRECVVIWRSLADALLRHPAAPSPP